MPTKFKVGFIIGPQGKVWDKTYYDSFSINKQRYWLNDVPKNLIQIVGKKTKARIDVAVAYALKNLLKDDKDIKYTILRVENVNDAEFKKHDLIINQFLDLLIEPRIPQFEKNGVPHLKLKELYQKYSKKIYPPVKYSNMVYEKCNYYDFLKQSKLPVAPTHCISNIEYKNSPRKSINSLVKHAKDQKWGKIFAKPTSSSDSMDISLMGLDNKEVRSYINKMFSKGHTAIVFQKYFPDFEVVVPQVRIYYLGGKHQYSMINWANGYAKIDETSAIVAKAKKIGKKVLDKIDPFFNGAPKLITRIDFGCCLNKSKTSAFINEIEFNPGLYLHLHGAGKFNFDYKVAKQLTEIINYKKNLYTK